MAFSRTRASPRVHLDGSDQESFPLTDHSPTNPTNHARRTNPKGPTANSLQPAALDATRLRRLSFGGGGVGAVVPPARKMLPALDRAKEGGGPVGPLVPLPMERPKFHHGDPRPRKPKVSKNIIIVFTVLGSLMYIVHVSYVWIQADSYFIPGSRCYLTPRKHDCIIFLRQ